MCPRQAFIDFLRKSFGQKRKTLWNNLKSDYEPEALRAALEKSGVKPTVRAEALSLEKSAALFRALLDGAANRSDLPLCTLGCIILHTFVGYERFLSHKEVHNAFATIRHPAVAGRFYPKRPQTSCFRDVASYLSPQTAHAPALGCVAPHAGYIYSGSVAGAVYAQLRCPERIIILCPNHTGKGRPLAIMSNGAWETPLWARRRSIRLWRSPEEKIPASDRRLRRPSQRTRHRS